MELIFSPQVFRSNKNLFSFTRSALEQYGIKPRKKLGQNFTTSLKYLSTFNKEIGMIYQQQKLILEVGTGIGTLTFYIAEKNPQIEVITIEKDRRLFETSIELAGSLNNITFVYADALEIIEKTKIPLIFSSTPFSISTPLLISICRNNNIHKAILGLQDEVAERIISVPGTKSYGRLTVLISLLFDVKLYGKFSPSSFYPKPEVYTSIIVLDRKNMYNKKIHSILENLTGCMFSQRNKLVKKALRHCIERLGLGEDLLETITLEERKRVRDLHPQEFLEIARKIV